ncbi:MAG: glycosyltransferase [Gemmatimonadota bacterium]|nr:MAG: glycosyltransferase [Gemmatimonadota bacterium]
MFGFILILFFLTAFYGIEGLKFLRGLSLLRRGTNEREFVVSVVVAVRNEERTIGACLEALLSQTYPKGKYEIIVVDDQSTDRTSEIVTSYLQDNSNVTLLKIEESTENWAPKKYALNAGIEKSRGEIILTTDADCLVEPTWIHRMISYFEEDIGMVAGFSQVGTPDEKLSLFGKLQAIDFLALMTTAAGAIGNNLPWAASGQNLAYRKEAFESVGGFERIRHRPSGDDVLLLQLVSTMTEWKIRFATSEESFVTTRPEKTVGAFLNQKRRWASNSGMQIELNKKFFAYLVVTFSLNVLLFITLPLSLVLEDFFFAPWISFVVKAGVDFAVIGKGTHMFRRHDLLALFPIWELVHIPYIVVTGILGTTGGFTWKERYYNR